MSFDLYFLPYGATTYVSQAMTIPAGAAFYTTTIQYSNLLSEPGGTTYQMPWYILATDSRKATTRQDGTVIFYELGCTVIN